jgi:hypothetical protein
MMNATRACSAFVMCALMSGVTWAQDGEAPKPKTPARATPAPRPAAVKKPASPVAVEPYKPRVKGADGMLRIAPATSEDTPAMAMTEPEALTPPASTPAEQVSTIAKADAASDTSLWRDLRGASIRARIQALESFVRAHPDHDLATVWYEEATLLRELAGLRALVGERPAAPANARGKIATGDGGEEEVVLDPVPPSKPAAKIDPAKKPEVRVAMAKTVTVADGGRAPEPKPGVRTHDGFYLRFATGYSYLSARYSGAVTACQGCTYGNVLERAGVSGSSMPIEIAMGVTAHGVVFGARAVLGAITAWSFDKDVETTVEGSGVMATAAGLVDWYPLTKHGLHVFASPGYTVAKLSDSGSRMPKNGLKGFSFGAGIGYEGWVSEQWSIGVQGRVDVAWLSNAETSTKLTTVSPGLQATFTYN